MPGWIRAGSRIPGRTRQGQINADGGFCAQDWPGAVLVVVAPEVREGPSRFFVRACFRRVAGPTVLRAVRGGVVLGTRAVGPCQFGRGGRNPLSEERDGRDVAWGIAWSLGCPFQDCLRREWRAVQQAPKPNLIHGHEFSVAVEAAAAARSVVPGPALEHSDRRGAAPRACRAIVPVGSGAWSALVSRGGGAEVSPDAREKGDGACTGADLTSAMRRVEGMGGGAGIFFFFPSSYIRGVSRSPCLRGGERPATLAPG